MVQNKNFILATMGAKRHRQVGADDGLLLYDRNGDGKINSANFSWTTLKIGQIYREQQTIGLLMQWYDWNPQRLLTGRSGID